jgi:hypothetical protein
MLNSLLALLAVCGPLLYYAPSVLDPVVWENPSPLLKFEGPTAVNNLLSNAVPVEGEFHGPESTAFDFETGEAYVSFGDGTIGLFTKDAKYVASVFFSGGYMQQRTANRTTDASNNGVEDRTTELMKWCHEESVSHRLAWNTKHERKCGRPLGLRFRLVC